MSAKFTKVKGYFDKGLWSARQVRDAVEKGWITAEEMQEIVTQPGVVPKTEME